MHTPTLRIHATTILVLLMLSQVLSGCNFALQGPPPTADLNLIGTQVALTVMAGLPSATPSETPTATATQVVLPTATSTSLFAVLTPTATLTAITLPTTPPPPPSPSWPVIRAQVDTNCRMGPSTKYPRLGSLLVGQTSTVYGRDSSNEWWLIENPKKPGQYCWVWGETTTVEGAAYTVPVVTPPPLPSGPSVSVAFSNVHFCGGSPTAVFRVTNRGNATLESVRLSVKDLDNGKTLFSAAVSNSPFMISASGCPEGRDSLPPDATGYVGGILNTKTVSGHEAQANLTLCTEEGLGGNCVSTKVLFTIQ